MIIYFVASERNNLICGPFTRKDFAISMVENYTGFYYGNCKLVEKEINKGDNLK